MDSKQKFIKNKYWKKKYKSRNVTNNINKQKSIEQKNDESNEFILKQFIPKEGWFPEYDSSSSSSDTENFNSYINSQSINSTSHSKSVDNNKEFDNDWFDKKTIKFKSDINIVDKHHSNLMLTLQENIEHEACNSNIKLNIVKEKQDDKLDNDEAELEFLLSLTEPVYTGPLIVKHNVKNERKIVMNNCIQQKPIKSIDLEKWLDSVLDD
ncbi:PREDICTED: uncharacterized protein LOC105368180 [Ceratosolen solmsi marchali]|uniref:Uncharacterized protein LOC105368180 n=1 Tax=Ceratosolen solmsi marchali TaxID=326594 RepID=A0AAJ7E2H8_9HYME|nr:PREDICTED: uncharacterized protein LOC105368180 [Ceratosolen solmsi marchali]